MVAKKTKLMALQEYYAKNGFRLEQLTHKVKGRIKYEYRLIATYPWGGIKKGDVVTRASTLAPFERMRRTRFLERQVPKLAQTRARITPRRSVRITPKTPRLR